MEDDPKAQKLIAAVKEGDFNEVNAVLNTGFKPEVIIPAGSRDVTWCLLALAASLGHTNIVENLGLTGLSVEGSGNDDRTPLMLAARRGHSETVQALLNLGADPLAKDKYGYSALHGAAQKGHLECVALLIDKTPPTTVNHDGATPVHSASFGGHVKVIEELERTNWRMKTKDCRGRTALHWAVSEGKLEAVQYLVEKANLEPLQKCTSGVTPLDYAVIFGRHAVEKWLLKHIGKVNGGNQRTLHHMKLRKKYDEEWQDELVSKIINGGMDLESYRHYNLHMLDKDGLAPLHIAARLGISSAVEKLLSLEVHPHVKTRDGLTAFDIAREEKHFEVLSILESHKCSQNDGTSEMLYEKMLNLIHVKDDVTQVSQLLCAGCPVQPVGKSIRSALEVAVNSDRPRILSLLLAVGATLTPFVNGLNLLQQAWSNSNATSAVLCSLTTAYSSYLRVEKYCLKDSDVEIQKNINSILKILEGDTPWKAAWSKGDPVHLTALMRKAAYANCPTTAAFLKQAGAWCFFSNSNPSPLHAALEAKHWSLGKTLVRDFGGCIYIPDKEGRFPRDMMPPEYRQELEKVTYEQERQKLRALADRQKDQCMKDELETVLRLQEKVFFRLPVQVDCKALMLVVRNGLLHLTHLLVKDGYLSVDAVLDNTTGSTALHEAASHGKSACAALLMTAGADPLQCDRYGQTPFLLAAMFGHSDTFHLMAQHVDKNNEKPCRAGTTACQTRQNYDVYLECYRKCGDTARDNLTILDHREEKEIIKAILGTIRDKNLLQEAERAKVDFDKGEARQVKEAVEREMEKMIKFVEVKNRFYNGSLCLVGSSHDGSKLYAPDEFDFNLVISFARVGVTVDENPERKTNDTEPLLQVKVESTDNVLQGNRFVSDLYEAIEKYFHSDLLGDKRLSVVPPGLTKTKIGVALAMAWQGKEYPLLLVSVDLVPVLTVPWDEKIQKPALTPPNTTHMRISNTADGLWRCSFAEIEASVLRGLQPEERQVYLTSKTLLSCLKTEPWMPQELKAFCTWWCTKQWKIPVPKVFCLKNSFLTLLESKRKNDSKWSRKDLMRYVKDVFTNMCSENRTPKLSYAYFGGDCEGPTWSTGADTIINCLQW